VISSSLITSSLNAPALSDSLTNKDCAGKRRRVSSDQDSFLPSSAASTFQTSHLITITLSALRRQGIHAAISTILLHMQEDTSFSRLSSVSNIFEISAITRLFFRLADQGDLMTNFQAFRFVEGRGVKDLQLSILLRSRGRFALAQRPHDKRVTNETQAAREDSNLQASTTEPLHSTTHITRVPLSRCSCALTLVQP
jgi:hypothetical protein